MKQYSLSELCAVIEDVICTQTESSYWVRAEIASISERGGHLYLDLVEKAHNGLLAAKLRATCWSNVHTMLRPYFEQETGSKLQPGMQILIEVEVTFHAVYGISANIINIDPKYTLGDLARQRQETIKRLEDEGVIAMNKSLVLPTIVRRLAVISSESAAGYGDFLHQLHDNKYGFDTTLFSAIMQGEHAAMSIIAALDAIARQEEEYDAVVIIRGGGATTDLSCYDDYNLCNHCAQFVLPIITGIGHTRDISVLDMVAFLALKTPTAVAQFFVSGREQEMHRLDDLLQRLKQTAERQILIRRHKIDILEQSIRLHSPERIYKMGYCVVTKNGKVVRSITEVHKNDIITTHLQDGQTQSIIQ